jgi:hypothetical protein
LPPIGFRRLSPVLFVRDGAFCCLLLDQVVIGSLPTAGAKFDATFSPVAPYGLVPPTRDGDITDDLGVVLPNVEAARDQAAVALAEMAKEASRLDPPQDQYRGPG